MKQEYTGTLTSPSLEVLFNTYDVRTSQRIYHLINHREDAACVVVVACPGQ